MSNHQPLLSICIPTYNRCVQLEETLYTIANDETFLNTFDVEVVISDNCSPDNTEKVCQKFIQMFPDKIFYYRTETNIGGDANFSRVLSLAKGKLLKLNNDKFMFLHGAIARIIEIIKQYYDEKYILFFPNNSDRLLTKEKEFTCHNINEFVSKTSFVCTWIGAFTIWKKDFETFENFDRYAHLQLLQVDVLYRLLSSGKQIKVFNDLLLKGLPVKDQGGYNPALVFGKNYLFILEHYLISGQMEPKIYAKEKKRTFLMQVAPLYFDYKKQYVFHKDGLFKYIFPIYKKNPYFYISIMREVRKSFFYPLLKPFRLVSYKVKVIVYSFLKNEEKANKYKEKLK